MLTEDRQDNLVQRVTCDTNEFIYKTETNPQTENKELPMGKRDGRGKLGLWDEQINPTKYKIDKITRTYCIAQGTILNVI